MYLSPSHPDYERLSARKAPPEPSGTTVAVLDRPGGRFGPDSELRVSIETYQGHQYVNLMVWGRKPDGVMAPTAKRLSIKLRELDDLAAALSEAARLAGAEGQGAKPARKSAPRRQPAARPAPTGDRRQPGLPLAGSAAAAPPPWREDFDEFAG